MPKPKRSSRIAKAIGTGLLSALPIFSGISAGKIAYDRLGEHSLATHNTLFMDKIRGTYGYFDLSESIKNEIAEKNKKAGENTLYYFDPYANKIDHINLKRYNFSSLRIIKDIMSEGQFGALWELVYHKVGLGHGSIMSLPINKRKLHRFNYIMSLPVNERTKLFSKDENDFIRSVFESIQGAKLALLKSESQKQAKQNLIISSVIGIIMAIMIRNIVTRTRSNRRV